MEYLVLGFCCIGRVFPSAHFNPLERAAEQPIFERVTTGVADDLVKATDIARSMVTRYGISQKLGQLSYEGNRHGFYLSRQPNTNLKSEAIRRPTRARSIVQCVKLESVT